jgi:peptidyl-prolyl cis-trans isomerase C
MVLMLGSTLRMKRQLTAVLLLIFSLIASTGRAADDAVLATVNGVKVTERDLGFLYVSRRVPEAQREAVRGRFVEDLIERVLLKQYLAKHKVEASKVLLDQQMARLETLFKEDGKSLEEALKVRGYTRASFRDELSLSLRWRAHALQVLTEDKIRDYWDKHRYEYDGTEVRGAQIVKKVRTDADILRLQSELSGIRNQIVAKELTFAEAAKKHSESPSADEGGDLGSFGYRGKMPIEITQVAFRLKPGEVSEPIQTRFGMHLITVTEISAGDLSLEDARSEILETLSQEMQRRLLKQLKTEAKIEKPKA